MRSFRKVCKSHQADDMELRLSDLRRRRKRLYVNWMRNDWQPARSRYNAQHVVVCELVVAEIPFLADALVGAEIDTKRTDILRDYGLLTNNG